MHSILNRFDNSVIHRCESAEDVRDAVLDAVAKGISLTGANLTGVDLTEADLTRANLTGVDLTGANLTEAKLTRANLTRVDLTRANLTRAKLTRANLTEADLTRANLTRADLTRANLTGVDLTGAKLGETILPDGKTLPEYIVWLPTGLLVQGGKPLADVVAAWDKHTWNDCPMHCAFGVAGLSEVPDCWRSAAATFVALFDGKHLPKPEVVAA